jgi:galactokinase
LSQTPSKAASASLARSTFTAPGRVNLLGEHVDYTGGLVLPMAIPFATTVELRPAASTSDYTFESVGYPETRSLSRFDRSPRDGSWSDYPVGVLRELQKLGIEPPPFTLHFHGNVPQGAGLSSSASIEVAAAMTLLACADASLPLEEIATLCQRAENLYVGSPCGVMDQFVVTAATRGHALLLNTRGLTYEHLPLDQDAFADCVFVVSNSGVRHSVATGDYGLRRRELEAGQAFLCERFHLRDLGEASLAQLNQCTATLSPESFRRCRHVISENQRVRKVCSALQTGKPEALGLAMTASHISQRVDFECSVEEIDLLVETAVRLDGCFGSRLTGGGFGGCTVSLVLANFAEAFSQQLARTYQQRFDRTLETYICAASDGAVALAQGA